MKNTERTEVARSKLVAAGRELFGTLGFQATSTPKIAQTAGVSRGTLYHHFEDKSALFQSVIEAEFERVSAAIDEVIETDATHLDALITGGQNFVAAMQDPISARLILVEGPAVLGHDAVRELDRQTTTETLRLGIVAAQNAGVLPKNVSPEAVTSLMSGAYDRAVMDIIADPQSQSRVLDAIAAIWAGLAASSEGTNKNG